MKLYKRDGVTLGKLIKFLLQVFPAPTKQTNYFIEKHPLLQTVCINLFKYFNLPDFKRVHCATSN